MTSAAPALLLADAVHHVKHVEQRQEEWARRGNPRPALLAAFEDQHAVGAVAASLAHRQTLASSQPRGGGQCPPSLRPSSLSARCTEHQLAAWKPDAKMMPKMRLEKPGHRRKAIYARHRCFEHKCDAGGRFMSSGTSRSSVRKIPDPEVYVKLGNSNAALPKRIKYRTSILEEDLSSFLSQSVVWWSVLFILCLILVVPMALVDVPPLLDYPNHLARAYVLAHVYANPHLSQMYAPHWTIIPNLALDLILPPLLTIMPVHTAGRILLAVTLVLPVGGTVLYSQAVFGRRSYWPLASCMVASNGLFLLGFVNFQLGMGLALVCAASWRRWRDTRPMAAVAVGVVFAVVLFFSHLMGLLFFLILLLSYEIEKFRKVQRQGLSLAANLLRAAWSIPILLFPSALYVTSAFGGTAADVSWETWQEKLIRAAMSVVNYNLPLDIVTACFIAGVLVTLARLRLLLVPLGSIFTLAMIAVLFMISPFGFKGTGYVDARFAVMFGFLLFNTILPVRLPRKGALFLGFAMVLLFCVRTAQTAAVWGAHNRDLEQLRGAISVVEPGSRVLVAAVSLEEVDRAQPNFLGRQYLSDGSRLDGHAAALLLIERHAFWPFLFANPEQQPVELRSPFREIAKCTAGIPGYQAAVRTHPRARGRGEVPAGGQMGVLL